MRTSTKHSGTGRLAAMAAAALALGALLAPAGAQAAPAAAPACGNGDVTASYRGGDAATSHVYGRIVLRNTSDRTCSLRGFGGLSYVGGGDGHQVGAAADRDRTGPQRTVVLEPGERARSKVSETSTGPYSDQECQPTPVDGFRVYVPGATRSQFVAHPTTGCADTDVHLLSHQAYRAP